MKNMTEWLQQAIVSRRKQAFPILSFPSISLMNITVRELIADSALQARGMKAVADRIPSLASVGMMDLSVEAESFGSKIRVSDDEVPTVIGRIIESEDDANKMLVPDVHAGRTGLYINAIKEAVGLISDRPVFAGCIGPFSLAGRLMDVTEVMVNCYEEPDMVHTTLEKVTEFITNYIMEYKKIGAHGVVMAEPLAGLLSPELAAEFSATYVKRIRDAVRDDNFLFFYHNCGNNTIQMVESILSIKADAYHFGNAIDMEAMIKKVPEDVIVMGNLDPASIFLKGTPESVREETLKLMEKCCKYKNYIVSSGCDIPPATPWANIDAFFAAVEEYNQTQQ